MSGYSLLFIIDNHNWHIYFLPATLNKTACLIQGSREKINVSIVIIDFRHDIWMIDDLIVYGNVTQFDVVPATANRINYSLCC